MAWTKTFITTITAYWSKKEDAVKTVTFYKRTQTTKTNKNNSSNQKKKRVGKQKLSLNAYKNTND